MPRLLLIDDDQRLAEMVGRYLSSHGWEVDRRADARSGKAALAAGGYDAAVLDLGLPDQDGLDLCREVRARGDAVPILMLTARGDDTDRILGLELGADDYLPKPFNPRELLARLRALLRRSRPAPDEVRVVHVAGLTVDRDRRRVTVDGRPVSLTGHQFEILWVLATHAGRVLSRDRILRAVRGEELAPFDRSIDVHISRIRHAVERDPKRPERILTVRGAGYVLARPD